MQTGIGPEAEEIRIGLHDVEERVLRLGIVLVQGAQAHVRDGLPGTTKGFQITAVLLLAAVFFDQMKNGDGLVERFRFSGGGVVFAQGVDGEGLAVNLFAITQYGAVCRDRPIKSAVFRIMETCDEIGVGVIRHGQVGRIAVLAVCGGIGPQDARGEQGATLGGGVEREVVGQ